MSNLTQDLSAAELWPIKAKGKVQRLNPLGDPEIEHYYHQALEQGRHLERNIADANHWLQQKKKDLIEKILIHTRSNQLAVDGQLPLPARKIKYVADSIKIIQDVAKFQKEIIGLIGAVNQNLVILLQMEASMLAMVQQNLNALAMLLNQICNWGLPKLPSIPNLFADTIWHWNGFNFVPLSAFANLIKGISFNTNFAFGQCMLNSPNTNIFQNTPTLVSTYGGQTYGTAIIVPPLSGTIADPTNPTLLQQTTTPPAYLSPSSPAINLATPFSTNTSMLGAVPDPSTIISDYQMPAATYQANIVSIVPETRDQTVFPTDTDYANPNLTVRNPNLRKALVHYVTLGAVVASNYDPNLTAEWLFYLNICRVGRSGSWLQNFQVAYVNYISPSLTYLEANAVPWNCVVPCNTISNAPTAIPLITELTSLMPSPQGNVLWQLSYIEAALLGYARNQTWDSYANANYTSSFTGTDLDYTSTSINLATTTTITLGENEAEYPTPCTFPSAIGNAMQAVIAIADINIKNTPTYTTTRPQFKYIYNQFALATEVDRFSQFWREFNANVQALLLQDPYLIQFVVTYPAALDSAVDPLGDPTIYNQISADAASRNRSWAPGYPLLPIPVAPIVGATVATGPAAGQSGWTGTSFDPNTFLSRPDIQQLPISTQIAMLRTNLSYADTQQSGQDISDSIQSSIQQNQLLLQEFQNFGFKAEVSSAINAVNVGSNLPVQFDQEDFDLTGNITSSSTFTFQTAGNYALVVVLNWGAGDAGTRTGTILLNNATALDTYSTDDTVVGPTFMQMSITQYFAEGDMVTVVASDSLSSVQYITAGSYISATLIDMDAPEATPPVPTQTTATTYAFNAATSFSSLTALIVDANGNVTPVDPTTVQTDSKGDPIYPIVSGVSLDPGTEGQAVTVGSYYGGVYEVDGAGFTTGGLIYAITGGAMSQDYSVVNSTCQWVVVIGRAISSTQFIYEPHIPNLKNLGSF